MNEKSEFNGDTWCRFNSDWKVELSQGFKTPANRLSIKFDKLVLFMAKTLYNYHN